MFNIIEVNGNSRAFGIRAFKTERQESINKGNTEINYSRFTQQNITNPLNRTRHPKSLNAT